MCWLPGAMRAQAAGDAVAVFGFADLDGGVAVEAFGEAAGEDFGHVLDDDGARCVARELGEDVAEGFGAAGGGAEGDDAAFIDGAARGYGCGRGVAGVEGQAALEARACGCLG